MRMGDNAFFKKMYRLSWEDQEDWGAVVDAANSSGPPRPPRPRDPMGAMQREYLQAVIKPEQFYSVSVLKQCDDPIAEAPVEFEEEVFFQCISLASGSHRAKAVEVLGGGEEEDARRHAALAVEVQYMNTFIRRSQTLVTAYFDSDPVYVNSLDLAPFSSLRTTLLQWSGTTSDNKCCFDLSDPRSAAPTLALTDDEAPTCMILDHLRAIGWAPMNGAIVHTDLTKHMDGRKPESKKQYFQTLLQLEDRLRSNGEVHSDQPQNYFKCVNLGLKVEPNLGDKWYKQRLQLKPGEVLALPAPPVALALEDVDVDLDLGDFDIVGIGDTAPKKARPKRSAPKAKIAAAAAPVPFHLPILPPADPSSSSSSSSSDASMGSDFDVVGVPTRSVVTEWQLPMDDGPRIKLDSYQPKGKQRYQRFIAECTVPGHCKCTKKRNANLTESYGPSEPVAFLLAWAEAGQHCTEAEHKSRKCVVPQARVAHFVGKLGHRAKALTDLVVVNE